MTHVAHIRRANRAAHHHAPSQTHAHAAAPAQHHQSATTFVTLSPRKALKDMTVQERFSTLQDRFDPSTAKGVDVSFQFNISGEGGGKWFCTIKGGKLTVKVGTGSNPTATLSASASDYLKIANGKMNKMWALVQGKLKVQGDKEELKKWDTYFKG